MTDKPGVPGTAAAERNVAYAIETHRLALELRSLVFPPWRWPRWFRLYREVQHRREVLRLFHDAADHRRRVASGGLW